MSDLVEFLRAHLDEVWEVAQRENTYPNGNPLSRKDWDDVAGTADSMLVGMFSPAHVLADVEAKRRIIELHTVYDDDCRTCGESWDWSPVQLPYPCNTLRLLALPYAEHEDYRAEWTPS